MNYLGQFTYDVMMLLWYMVSPSPPPPPPSQKRNKQTKLSLKWTFEIDTETLITKRLQTTEQNSVVNNFEQEMYLDNILSAL